MSRMRVLSCLALTILLVVCSGKSKKKKKKAKKKEEPEGKVFGGYPIKWDENLPKKDKRARMNACVQATKFMISKERGLRERNLKEIKEKRGIDSQWHARKFMLETMATDCYKNIDVSMVDQFQRKGPEGIYPQTLAMLFQGPEGQKTEVFNTVHEELFDEESAKILGPKGWNAFWAEIDKENEDDEDEEEEDEAAERRAKKRAKKKKIKETDEWMKNDDL